jgi:hypothetical protein
MSRRFIEHCANGNFAEVDRAMQEQVFYNSDEENYDLLDPSAYYNAAIRKAAEKGHFAVVKRLLQDERVDPSDLDDCALQWAAVNGHLSVLNLLLQDKRVDPATGNNSAVRWAACNGHLAVVERLLQDERVNADNCAVRLAVDRNHFNVVDRLLEEKNTSFSAVLDSCPPEKLIYFEYREQFTEICIALQELHLPAWVTMMILKARYPWTSLPIHKRWSLVCTVKHFRNL